MESGEGLKLAVHMNESIHKVIERCEWRMERSLDCHIDDVRRLISEVRRLTPQPAAPDVPLWHGKGSGD